MSDSNFLFHWKKKLEQVKNCDRRLIAIQRGQVKAQGSYITHSVYVYFKQHPLRNAL
jgi:hypothetical protein